MASLIASPDLVRINQPVTILGWDFANTTECVIQADALGLGGEVASDGTGQVSGSGLADHAKVTLTSSGVFAAAETVTIGTTVYTFRASLTNGGLAYEVLIGAAATNSLDNLKAAINRGAVSGSGEGTIYGRGTVRHPDVIAGAKTATTLVVVARIEGTAANSIASTETCTNAAFGAATLSGGAAAVARAFRFLPAKEGTYYISCTDGTNTASTTVQVWASA